MLIDMTIRSSFHNMSTYLAVGVLGIIFLHEGHSQQSTAPALPIPPSSVKAFLPASAELLKELTIDFDDTGHPDVALVFAVPYKDVPSRFDTGVRILSRSSSGWALVFAQSDVIENGGGIPELISATPITSSDGHHGLLVALNNAGAGTATDWYVVASVHHTLAKLEPQPTVETILAGKNYQNLGYNGVKALNNLIIDTEPGYSQQTARCCPDSPSLKITYRFTGSSLVLDSVKDIPLK